MPGEESLPKAIKAYVRWVEALNRVMGRIAMYLIFVLIGILLWSSVSKTFFLPSPWTLEMAQFTMVAYYIMGGPYSIQLGANVRMDLFYGDWSPRTKAWFDIFTVLFLLFYLGVLLYGGVGSTAYSLGYYGSEIFGFLKDIMVAVFSEVIRGNFSEISTRVGEITGTFERSPTAWRPYLWPIKLLMVIGISFMILQALAEFFKDIGRIRGEAL
jgi:TRAP-type mannitol/chloroaromatic compound transport system permease small subunit